jgi:hypothetical protein
MAEANTALYTIPKPKSQLTLCQLRPQSAESARRRTGFPSTYGVLRPKGTQRKRGPG